MTRVLAGRSIEKIRIVDDEPSARDTYGYPVEDLCLQPIPAQGPFSDLETLVAETQNLSDAAICDQRLGGRSYASFDGAELVARLYQSEFPAVLCTQWDIDEIIDEIRQYRRYLPVLLKPEELEPDSLVHGLERCIGEFSDEFQPSRRPWRALVRIERVDKERAYFYVVIPGWDPHEAIRLPLASVRPEIQERIRKEEKRFHAQVNIGAEGSEDLYFEWEID